MQASQPASSSSSDTAELRARIADLEIQLLDANANNKTLKQLWSERGVAMRKEARLKIQK